MGGASVGDGRAALHLAARETRGRRGGSRPSKPLGELGAGTVDVIDASCSPRGAGHRSRAARASCCSHRAAALARCAASRRDRLAALPERAPPTWSCPHVPPAGAPRCRRLAGRSAPARRRHELDPPERAPHAAVALAGADEARRQRRNTLRSLRTASVRRCRRRRGGCREPARLILRCDGFGVSAGHSGGGERETRAAATRSRAGRALVEEVEGGSPGAGAGGSTPAVTTRTRRGAAAPSGREARGGVRCGLYRVTGVHLRQWRRASPRAGRQQRCRAAIPSRCTPGSSVEARPRAARRLSALLRGAEALGAGETLRLRRAAAA